MGPLRPALFSSFTLFGNSRVRIFRHRVERDSPHSSWTSRNLTIRNSTGFDSSAPDGLADAEVAVSVFET